MKRPTLKQITEQRDALLLAINGHPPSDPTNRNIYDACDTAKRARERSAQNQKEIQAWYADTYARFLEWRDIEHECKECSATGRKAYGSTATWRGGIGGQMITADVCDKCWGTGDANRKGVNLRVLMSKIPVSVVTPAPQTLREGEG